MRQAAREGVKGQLQPGKTDKSVRRTSCASARNGRILQGKLSSDPSGSKNLQEEWAGSVLSGLSGRKFEAFGR